MRRIYTSIIKEILVLTRDTAGLVLIFLMPVVLIFVMALIQDSTFRKMDETVLSVLFIDQDQDSVGLAIEQGLLRSEMIRLEKTINGQPLDEQNLVQLNPTLGTLAAIVAERGEPARAARLWGAGTHFGAPWPIFYQAFAAVIEASRTALGDRHDELLAEGAALDVDAAIALAATLTVEP